MKRNSLPNSSTVYINFKAPDGSIETVDEFPKGESTYADIRETVTNYNISAHGYGTYYKSTRCTNEWRAK